MFFLDHVRNVEVTILYITHVTGIKCSTPPVPANAQLVQVDTVFEYEDYATFVCVEGYEKTGGNDLRQCLATGDWSGDPIECSRK